MKAVQLPNGFVLDLDSVHYILSEIDIRHPFTGEYTGEVTFFIQCEGNTKIIMRVTKDQSKEIHDIILKHLNEKRKGIEYGRGF